MSEDLFRMTKKCRLRHDYFISTYKKNVRNIRCLLLVVAYFMKLDRNEVSRPGSLLVNVRNGQRRNEHTYQRALSLFPECDKSRFNKELEWALTTYIGNSSRSLHSFVTPK
ncbi:hypothetical protein PUN28_011193 [Cardiocondyla obscurior]|uniref:Uncharacterized protein n=1 Tax=Cardiocondyla obscurior TaxID=286306 RepID=A0AAW2FMB5_9HYME